jgi:hypothetical protein
VHNYSSYFKNCPEPEEQHMTIDKLGAEDVFYFGTWIGCLEEDCKPDKPSWDEVKADLQMICSFKSATDLESIVSEARSFLNSFTRKYKGKNQKMEYDDGGQLNTAVQNWYGRIAEISKKWILIMPKTHLDIAKLSSGAEQFFLEDEWKSLSELEQQGINEAATCLLTNNFTASECLALRTAESVVRRWHEKRSGKSIDNIAWGNILEYIEEQYPEKGRPNEISAIFHLKRRRNAIAHPDEISNESSASVTFIYVMDTLKAINNSGIKESHKL